MSESAAAQSSESVPSGNAAQLAIVINRRPWSAQVPGVSKPLQCPSTWRVQAARARIPPPLESPSPWSLLETNEPSPQSVPRGSATQPARVKNTMKPTVNWLSQPSSKRNRTATPTHLARDCNSRSLTVAYISCTACRPECKANRVCHDVVEAATKAIEAGAKIINIAFTWASSHQLEHEIRNNICIQLKLAFDAKWTSSVEQPAYSYRHTGSVMSFFSVSLGKLISEAILDPEGGLPSTMLTFDTPSGVLCVITTSLTRIPSRTRARLLNFYTNAAAQTNADCMLVGGSLDDLNPLTKLSLQIQVANLSLDFELVTNADLYVLARGASHTMARSLSEPNNLTSNLVFETFVPEPQC